MTETARPQPRELPDWLLARGRPWATTSEIAELLGIPERHVAPTLAPSRRRGLLFAPTKGLWVMIPAEFRLWGAVPGLHFVDAWMNHLGHPYYVGLLSAAQIAGYSQQSPQVLQVVTDARLRDRAFGRVRFDFTYSCHVRDRAVSVVNTPTGTARVSTAEVTVLDLLAFPHASGGQFNAATIVGDMLADGALDPARLASTAAGYPVSTVARAGWIVDLMANQVGAEFDTDGLLERVATRSTPVVLNPAGPRGGDRDERWNVIVNEYPEEES